MAGLTDADGLYFIGNATMVIRYGGFTLLTDPNFLRRGQRAFLGYGLNSRRLRDPAISIDELPRMDAVILSHLHGDHWDRVTTRHLDRDLPIVTTSHASRGWPGAASAAPVPCECGRSTSSSSRAAAYGSPRCPDGTASGSRAACCRR